MKFSEQWLKEWVNLAVDTQTLVNKITMAGLEVDETLPVAGEFSGVVVGEIVACEQHPDADKLRVTQVSTGSETFQVVCGAPNARVGIKVPFATVGAVLPGNFKIKKAKLRGVESFGMLCAEQELAISEASDGLMELALDAPVGEDIRTYLRLNDTIIDVDLTPNRGDCLSIAGLAREVSANFSVDVTPVAIEPVAATISDTFPIQVEAKKGCPRYVGRVIKNVDVSKKAPLWLTERLRRAGIRSIDPVVDVTNYVMLELGQPMHGFDLDRLAGGICVRMANAGEKLVLLNEQEVTLNESVMLIADEEKALAIAGVMGGEHSGVSETTKNIFLESAYFDQITVAGKARSFGLHTDSSHRFERGVDFQLQQSAVERATALIISICGGEAGSVTEVASEAHLPALRTVTLRAEKVRSLLGVNLDDAETEVLLTRLGFGVEMLESGRWAVAVPSWRFDVSIEEDLVEELGRIFGYDNLPKTIPTSMMKLKQIDEAQASEKDVRRVLVSRGYQEALCFAFISPELHELFSPEHAGVILKNPIASDLSVMRTSLLPGLLKTTNYNLNRQQSRVRLFETGLTFNQTEAGLQQTQKFAAVITGSRLPQGWQQKAESVDFFDLKGDIEAVLGLGQMASQFTFRKGSHAAMHPGQCAEVVRDGEVIGHIGAIHPLMAKALDVPTALYMVELDMQAVLAGKVTAFEALSKFPEVRRDLALLVKIEVNAGDIEQVIEQSAGELLRKINTFDVYAGKGIEEGHKSLALSLTLQHPSRTLKDDEINALIEQVVQQLKTQLQASLRQ